MRILFGFLAAAALAACSNYPNKILLCRGNAYNIGDGSSGPLPNQVIGVRIENGKISFSGNQLFYGMNIETCKIGTTESAQKDELYFEKPPACRSTNLPVQRIYGTYNFITRQLHISDSHIGGILSATFQCDESK